MIMVFFHRSYNIIQFFNPTSPIIIPGLNSHNKRVENLTLWKI